jgi:hypothetical protein
MIEIWRAKPAAFNRLLSNGTRYLPRLGKHILLTILVLPDAESSTVQEPVGPQQGQDDVPHDSEVIAMSFVLKGQNTALRHTGEIVDSKQIFYGLPHILQRVAPPFHGSSVKEKFYFHFAVSPVV